jgi:hypothetical protein
MSVEVVSLGEEKTRGGRWPGPLPDLTAFLPGLTREMGLWAWSKRAPDYLLVGTVFPTDSRPGHPGGGLGLVERAAWAVALLPVLATGGIDAGNAGAAGIAGRSAILTAPDLEEAALAIRKALTPTEHTREADSKRLHAGPSTRRSLE